MKMMMIGIFCKTMTAEHGHQMLSLIGMSTDAKEQEYGSMTDTVDRRLE
jgi:hypothetical protein